MRVVRARRFGGGPEVLDPGEAPDPQPGPGEIVVDVAVAEVGLGYFEVEPPFVPGEGVAGVVASGQGTSAAEQRRYAEAARARLTAGDIRPANGQVLPLERAADAHAAIEARTAAGKTLLVTGRETA
jgi:NADPH:quinone reductase-like Zn-dependent oxidoreductase